MSILSILATTPLTTPSTPKVKAPQCSPEPTCAKDYKVTAWQGHQPDSPDIKFAVIKGLPDLRIPKDERTDHPVEIQGVNGPEGRTIFQVNQRADTLLPYIHLANTQRKWAILAALETFLLTSDLPIPLGSTFSGPWGTVTYIAGGLDLPADLKREAEQIHTVITSGS